MVDANNVDEWSCNRLTVSAVHWTDRSPILVGWVPTWLFGCTKTSFARFPRCSNTSMTGHLCIHRVDLCIVLWACLRCQNHRTRLQEADSLSSSHNHRSRALLMLWQQPKCDWYDVWIEATSDHKQMSGKYMSRRQMMPKRGWPTKLSIVSATTCDFKQLTNKCQKSCRL